MVFGRDNNGNFRLRTTAFLLFAAALSQKDFLLQKCKMFYLSIAGLQAMKQHLPYMKHRHFLFPLCKTAMTDDQMIQEKIQCPALLPLPDFPKRRCPDRHQGPKIKRSQKTIRRPVWLKPGPLPLPACLYILVSIDQYNIFMFCKFFQNKGNRKPAPLSLIHLDQNNIRP